MGQQREGIVLCLQGADRLAGEKTEHAGHVRERDSRCERVTRQCVINWQTRSSRMWWGLSQIMYVQVPQPFSTPDPSQPCRPPLSHPVDPPHTMKVLGQCKAPHAQAPAHLPAPCAPQPFNPKLQRYRSELPSYFCSAHLPSLSNLVPPLKPSFSFKIQPRVPP